VSPSVEVCFVSYSSGSVLEAAMTSVANHIPAATVAIQENGPTRTTLDRASRHAGELGVDVRTLHDASNPGFGAACNSLAATSSATWLLFFNCDAEIVAWPYTQNDPPMSSILGPAHVEATRSASHRGVSYTIGDEVRRSWFRRAGPAPDGAGFVSGAALLVERTTHETIGGFDERFFLYYEDIEYCLRANKAGHPTHLASGWIVRHQGAHTTSEHFQESLAWSFESGTLFHRLAGHSVVAYRCYVALDALARTLLHTLRRDRVRRSAYSALLRRVYTDITKPSRT
jgi:N-acetylglucosaminyl-diphospho-decaprenol L-rhamnosyltransferase